MVNVFPVVCAVWLNVFPVVCAVWLKKNDNCDPCGNYSMHYIKWAIKLSSGDQKASYLVNLDRTC